MLLTGASGFIGSHLAGALIAAGHHVVCAVRRAPPHDDAVRNARARKLKYITVDFTRDFDAADWLPRLEGIDAVINAVGIIREQGAQTFSALHERAPQALFTACAQRGMRRVIQISALGADEGARSGYHLSKRRTDDFLAGLPLSSVIVQPSLVFGKGGASARLFTMLASLPLIGLPGSGAQQIQPVHIDDVAAAILALLDTPMPPGTRVPLVGPQPMSLRDYLAVLRKAIGKGNARFLPVPMPLVRLGAAAGRLLPAGILDPETLDMLERGNTADAGTITRLLGCAPRAPADFLAKDDVAAARMQAQLGWLLPLLRLSVALVWIVTGIVSLGLYPVADSYALLARVGIHGMLAPLMLYGAALLDLLFGIATLALRRRYWRYWLWLAQAAVILFYTAIISWRLPEFWLHPYGPLLKNLPMLAAIWMLFELEQAEEA